MIYTTYFANLKNLPDNIIPISICGKAPKGWTGEQYKTLAPKYDFFMKWKETGDNEYYIDCFREQILNKLNVYKVLGDLINKLPYIVSHSTPHVTSPSSKFHIALVCYETPEKFCHRHLVSEWFRQNGIPCCEWDNTMTDGCKDAYAVVDGKYVNFVENGKDNSHEGL